MKFHISYETDNLFTEGKTIEAKSMSDALQKAIKEHNIKESNIIYISNMDKTTNR